MLINITPSIISVSEGFPFRTTLRDEGFKWHPASKTWRKKTSTATILDIYRVFNSNTTSDVAYSEGSKSLIKQALDEENKRLVEIANLTKIKESWATDDPIIDISDIVYDPKKPPYLHQQKMLTFLKHSKVGGVWVDCGYGKTATLLWHARRLKAANKVGKILVVCPKTVIYEWNKNIETFTPEMSYVNLDRGSVDNKLILKRKFAAEHPRIGSAYDKIFDIYLVNYESLSSIVEDILYEGFDMMILDESTEVKNPNAQCTKAAIRLSDHIEYRYLLSGTPFPQSELDAWSQMRIIEKSVFGDGFYGFRNTYFRATGFMGKKWVLSTMPATYNKFISKLDQYSLKVKADLDLPPQTHIEIPVKLDSKSTEIYRGAYDEAVLYASQFLAGENQSDIPLNNALAAIMKCRQIVNGFVFTKNGDETIATQLNTAKLDVVDEKLKEIGNNQVLIWASFKPEIAELHRRIPDSVTLYSDTANRKESLDDFLSGKKRVMIAHPESAGHGITFLNAKYIIDYSIDYNANIYAQKMKRTDRIGKTEPSFVFDLKAILDDGSPTIDKILYEVVANKVDSQANLLKLLTS